MKKLIRIDDTLLEAINENAKKIGNSTTKEINEMLWLALKPRSEQIKKVLAMRTSTMEQLNNKTKPKNKQTEKYTDEDYDKILDNL